MTFNPAAHEFLTANGFTHESCDEQVEDRGDVENGPMIAFYPAADIYTGDDERVIVMETGEVLVEPRDKAFEEWIEQEMGQ